MSTLDIVEKDSTTVKFERSKARELFGAASISLFFTVYYFLLFKNGADFYEKAFVSLESIIASIGIFFGPLLFAPILQKAYMTWRYGEVWVFDKSTNSVTRNNIYVMDMSEIDKISIKKCAGSDTPDTYMITFCLRHSKNYNFEEVSDLETADEFANCLSDLIGVNISKINY